MNTKVYPIKTVRLNNQIADREIPILWQSLNLPTDQIIYGVYHHYDGDHNGNYDFSIGLEKEDKQINPIEIDDAFHWFEIFKTNKELMSETWKTIWNKSKQGLLKRTYSLDFEKHYPDGRVEIYISIIPHC